MNAPQGVVLPTLGEIRRMDDAALLAYAEEQGDDDWAWDELAERSADRSYNA